MSESRCEHGMEERDGPCSLCAEEGATGAMKPGKLRLEIGGTAYDSLEAAAEGYAPWQLRQGVGAVLYVEDADARQGREKEKCEECERRAAQAAENAIRDSEDRAEVALEGASPEDHDGADAEPPRAWIEDIHEDFEPVRVAVRAIVIDVPDAAITKNGRATVRVDDGSGSLDVDMDAPVWTPLLDLDGKPSDFDPDRRAFYRDTLSDWLVARAVEIVGVPYITGHEETHLEAESIRTLGT